MVALLTVSNMAAPQGKQAIIVIDGRNLKDIYNVYCV